MKRRASAPRIGRQRRELARLFTRLAEGACARRLCLEPSVLYELGARLVRRRELLGPDRERVWCELHALQRHEQAALLCEAIELLLGTALEGRLLAPAAGALPDESAWRRRCAEEIGCALDTGAELPGELLACALQGRADWPTPLELLEPLLRLRPSARHRALAARARLASGGAAAAQQLVAHLDLDRLDSRSRAELLAALAVEAERRGRDREALEYFERAGTCGAGPEAQLSAAWIASQLGESARVEHLVEGLRGAELGAARLARAARDTVERRAWIERPLAARDARRLERLLELASAAPRRSFEGPVGSRVSFPRSAATAHARPSFPVSGAGSSDSGPREDRP